MSGPCVPAILNWGCIVTPNTLNVGTADSNTSCYKLVLAAAQHLGSLWIAHDKELCALWRRSVMRQSILIS